MCGRYVSSTSADQIAAYFGAAEGETLLEPNYNVAPTRDVPVVLQVDEQRRLEAFHWGLVPSWAKDPKIGSRMINARADGVATKNSFRAPFKRRRCLIPVDGFYEWVSIKGREKKQPMYITRTDGEMFAFAGLWERWKGPQPDFPLHSCTIITGEPNEKMSTIHHRMPVMLAPGDWDLWLDPSFSDTDVLQQLLVPAPSEIITYHPVATTVNNARNKGIELTDPIGPADEIPVEATLL